MEDKFNREEPLLENEKNALTIGLILGAIGWIALCFLVIGLLLVGSGYEAKWEDLYVLLAIIGISIFIAGVVKQFNKKDGS